ncbi:MAG: flagellar biosynthesis protein FlhG [Ignavibacteria bacterium]|nr:flagellar biosynthesis protein FlhG [Ignavibacteria bacterium]
METDANTFIETQLEAAEEAKLPYIITICSGKGGVGKSVLAANLAKAMSNTASVCVWDADIHFPNQHLLFGVEPPLRLKDVFSGMTEVRKAIYQIAPNIALLADKPVSDISQNDTPMDFSSVYAELVSCNLFDIIIIDSAAGDAFETLQCSAFSDCISIVVTDEPTSLIDAYGLIKLLSPYIEKKKINLIVNNVIDMEDADEISRKLNMATEKFLGMELDVLGFVPYDRAVRQSIIRQELLTNATPDCEASQAIYHLAETYMTKFNIFKI